MYLEDTEEYLIGDEESFCPRSKLGRAERDDWDLPPPAEVRRVDVSSERTEDRNIHSSKRHYIQKCKNYKNYTKYKNIKFKLQKIPKTKSTKSTQNHK